MSEVERVIERDTRAECVDPRCHRTSADRRVLAGEVRQLRARLENVTIWLQRTRVENDRLRVQFAEAAAEARALAQELARLREL